VVPALIEKALQEADTVQQVIAPLLFHLRSLLYQHRQMTTTFECHPENYRLVDPPSYYLMTTLRAHLAGWPDVDPPSPIACSTLNPPPFTQVLVYGTNRPHNIAVLVPNWEKVVAYGIQHGGGSLTVNSTKVTWHAA